MGSLPFSYNSDSKTKFFFLFFWWFEELWYIYDTSLHFIIWSLVFSHSGIFLPSTSSWRRLMTPLTSAMPHWHIPQPSSHLLFYLINTLCKKQRWAASIVGSSRPEPYGKSGHLSREPFSHLLSKKSYSRFLKLLWAGGQCEPEDEGVSKASGGRFMLSVPFVWASTDRRCSPLQKKSSPTQPTHVASRDVLG